MGINNLVNIEYILVYIAGMDQIEKNRHGRKNGCTRSVYENGMESGIYMQTLCKNLYRTDYTVQDLSGVEDDYLKKPRIANAKNEPTYLCADVETVAT